MISHQAVGKGVGDRLDVASVEFEEIGIVALFDKDVFAVVAARLDVVILAAFKWDGHGGLLQT